MSQILDVLFSQSFAEKAFLLILAAVLTGILVPYINAKLAHRKFKEQRLFEAAIARQNKIIDSQNGLLSELERLVHMFQLRALAVAWYKIHDRNSSKYEESRIAYEDNAWEFFINMQTTIGKASRLTSPDVHKELEKFYGDMRKMDSILACIIHKLNSQYGNS